MIMFLNLSDIVVEGMFRNCLSWCLFVCVCGGYLRIGQIRECPPPTLLYALSKKPLAISRKLLRWLITKFLL